MKICVFVVLVNCLLFSATSFARKSLTITQLSNDVFRHTSYEVIDGYGQVASHGLIVLNENDAYLIDTAWSNQDTQKIHHWIKNKGYTLVKSISTHAHQDRTGGMQYLNEQKISTVVHQKTQDILIEHSKALATQTFDGDRLSLAGDRIDIFYPGGGHSIDNLVVYLPKEKLLFGGCLIRPKEWQSIGNISDAHIEQWAKSVAKVKSKYTIIDVVVPGHGKVGDQALLDHTIKLVNQYTQH